MARQLRRRLTFANVCSFTALVFALGTGGAYAANTIGSADIIDESIQSVDIKNGQVGTADLGGSAVTSFKIANAAVGNSDIATGAVASNSVLDESLTSSDLATDSVGATEIADASIDSGEIVDNSLLSADLAPNSVGTSEVANKSLTLSDSAGAAVNGSISLSGIPNGRCSQVTFNVGGAQVGDSPIVTTRAAIQNGVLLYPNRVASTGHVEVNACNFTGTSMTPISSFPVRIITLR
jgi:hypothetical protein